SALFWMKAPGCRSLSVIKSSGPGAFLRSRRRSNSPRSIVVQSDSRRAAIWGDETLDRPSGSWCAEDEAKPFELQNRLAKGGIGRKAFISASASRRWIVLWALICARYRPCKGAHPAIAVAPADLRDTWAS